MTGSDSILGPKEDIKEILKLLGIKEGEKKQQKVSDFGLELIESLKETMLTEENLFRWTLNSDKEDGQPTAGSNFLSAIALKQAQDSFANDIFNAAKSKFYHHENGLFYELVSGQYNIKDNAFAILALNEMKDNSLKSLAEAFKENFYASNVKRFREKAASEARANDKLLKHDFLATIALSKADFKFASSFMASMKERFLVDENLFCIKNEKPSLDDNVYAALALQALGDNAAFDVLESVKSNFPKKDGVYYENSNDPQLTANALLAIALRNAYDKSSIGLVEGIKRNMYCEEKKLFKFTPRWNPSTLFTDDTSLMVLVYSTYSFC